MTGGFSANGEGSSWIKASRAFRQISKSGLSPVAAREMLAEYLRNGDLHARAEKIWRSDERSTFAAWKNCPDDAVGGLVPLKYWRLEKALEQDRARWRLVASQLLVTSRLKPVRRIMMSGVEFRLNDLQRLQPEAFGLGSIKPKRGRPTDKARRDAAWLIAIDALLDKMDHSVNLNDINQFESEAKVFWLTDQSRCGEYQVKEAARLLYNELEAKAKLIVP